MKIVVAGTGHMGLVTSACLSEAGHNVTIVDNDERKLGRMKYGIAPVFEPGLGELLKRNYDKGRLDFIIDYKTAYKDADLIFISVGTLERTDDSANLDYVFNICRQISDNIEKDCLVIVKSKVPDGTDDKVEEFLKENIKNNVHVEVASNSEFIYKGTAIVDTLHAKEIIIGVESKSAENILREVYKPFHKLIVVNNRRNMDKNNLLLESTSTF
jgi:UDPglucose 6-dehydrogenase